MLGLVMLAVVTLTVGVVTVYAFGARRETRAWLAWLVGGYAVLAALGVTAWLALRTV